MASVPITLVRVYLREGEHKLSKLTDFLHAQKVSGMTVLRGIAGFGPDGRLHTASLLDLSLDLPLVVEFYDTPERVDCLLADLQAVMDLPHVVSWPAASHRRDAVTAS